MIRWRPPGLRLAGVVVVTLVGGFVHGVAVAGVPAAVQVGPRPGVAPESLWTCPMTHPVKGYLSQSGGRVYFLPGNPFYDEANPERCYASEEEAGRDGAGPADDGLPNRPRAREFA